MEELKRIKKNRGLYLKNGIMKIFSYGALVAKVIKLNKKIEKLTDQLEDKVLNEHFLTEELNIQKAQVRKLTRELTELKKGK